MATRVIGLVSSKVVLEVLVRGTVGVSVRSKREQKITVGSREC